MANVSKLKDSFKKLSNLRKREKNRENRISELCGKISKVFTYKENYIEAKKKINNKRKTLQHLTKNKHYRFKQLSET